MAKLHELSTKGVQGEEEQQLGTSQSSPKEVKLGFPENLIVSEVEIVRINVVLCRFKTNIIFAPLFKQTPELLASYRPDSCIAIDINDTVFAPMYIHKDLLPPS